MLTHPAAAKMTEVRRADPAARRLTVLLVIVGVLVATLLIVGFERYRTLLRNWLLSEPGELGYRVRLVFFLSAAVLSAPLVAFALVAWCQGVTRAAVSTARVSRDP